MFYKLVTGKAQVETLIGRRAVRPVDVKDFDGRFGGL
jgi:hypothetical protein